MLSRLISTVTVITGWCLFCHRGGGRLKPLKRLFLALAHGVADSSGLRRTHMVNMTACTLRFHRHSHNWEKESKKKWLNNDSKPCNFMPDRNQTQPPSPVQHQSTRPRRSCLTLLIMGQTCLDFVVSNVFLLSQMSDVVLIERQ